jgi:uracil DNA glycosylase
VQITYWPSFFAENWQLIEEILNTIIHAQIPIIPYPSEVFNIFSKLDIDDISMVVIGKEPGDLPSLKAGMFGFTMAWTKHRNRGMSHRLLWEEFSRILIRYIHIHRPEVYFFVADGIDIDIPKKNVKSISDLPPANGSPTVRDRY